MTSEPGAGATLRSYARLVLRRKWWVAAAALLGMLLSLGLALTESRQYTATAQVLVQSATGPGALSTDPQQVTSTEVQTMLELVTSASVTATVRKELGSAPPVEATEAGQTDIIDITAVAAGPGLAARIANAYGRKFVAAQENTAVTNATTAEKELRDQISHASKQITELRRDGGSPAEITGLVNQQAVLRSQLSQVQVSGADATQALAFVTPALPPASPSSPKPAQDTLLGLLTGLILGLGAAFLRDSLDDAVTSKESAEQIADAPVLAAVPMVSSWSKRDRPLVVTLARPAAPATEAYRSLRTSLQFARQESDLRTILVTSPAASEGKTSTLANLGAVFAQAGQRVLMVSCDLRKPRLGQFFGIDEAEGLTTAILGQRPVQDLIQAAPGTANLWLLPSGPPPPNPAELLSGARSQAIFARLRAEFDLVLIDSPPILPVTDAAVLSRDADATLLVVAAFRTRTGDLQRAVEKLSQVSARLAGVVLNEATRQGTGYYSGYGRNGYYGPAMRELPVIPEQGGPPMRTTSTVPATSPGPATSAGGGHRKPRG